MLRLAVVASLTLAACHHDPAPIKPEPGETIPLPPASGTPVGYLIDSATDLKLRDDQLKQMQDIDASLAARDAELDTQLRQIERPTDEEPGPTPVQQKAGMKRERRNLAPGQNTGTNADSGKLHEIRNAQDRDAIKRVFAILDPAQLTTAKHILEDHGVPIPGEQKKEVTNSDDGKPVPGLEP